MDVSGKFYGVFGLFNILLLGIIFNVFYQVDCEGKDSFMAYFSTYGPVSCK